ncbi:hypothetical protein AVEN_259950-1 [Araneus ventricosus]|uniref:Alpha-ketoglutarate-dependent dioxygenase AlkB-like domain-containing protein n=1 Tax=Araneus ventricosus TaxID=182803 RepID=A0A4Y2NL06_ARAVE|nr:hypothetical protein AVEN_259950-1 [Araneus ventricosus]
MEHTKKYILVPNDEISKHVPTEYTFSELDREMRAILKNRRVLDDKRVKLCMQVLQKRLNIQDVDLEHEYSGHCELQLPWNRTMLKIKSDVEKKTGFDYNFVLLNFYESGHAKIGAHKDDESSLDQSVDIPTLSFGACRDMIFSKKGCKSVRKALEAGSLLLMHDQKEWTHAIIIISV